MTTLATTAALQHLQAARQARADGGRLGLSLCTDHAEVAYQGARLLYALCPDPQMAVVMYHARACVGKAHRFRGEHVDALVAYRAALTTVEELAGDVPELRQWLAPAYHDCYVEARLAGDYPAEMIGWATAKINAAEQFPERMFAFYHDWVYLRAKDGQCEANDLWTTARSSTHLVSEPFERMVLYANMARAAGCMESVQWFNRSVYQFERAVTEMGTGEGVAMQLLDVAEGARALKAVPAAYEMALRASRLAEQREEPVLRERAQALLGTLGEIEEPWTVRRLG